MDKIFKNEQMFSEVNSRLATAAKSIAPDNFPRDFALELYCECANKACYERISIPLDEYRQIKAGAQFVVKPEHVLLEFEEITAQVPSYWVVVKREEKAEKQFEV